MCCPFPCNSKRKCPFQLYVAVVVRASKRPNVVPARPCRARSVPHPLSFPNCLPNSNHRNVARSTSRRRLPNESVAGWLPHRRRTPLALVQRLGPKQLPRVQFRMSPHPRRRHQRMNGCRQQSVPHLLGCVICTGAWRWP